MAGLRPAPAKATASSWATGLSLPSSSEPKLFLRQSLHLFSQLSTGKESQKHLLEHSEDKLLPCCLKDSSPGSSRQGQHWPLPPCFLLPWCWHSWCPSRKHSAQAAALQNLWQMETKHERRKKVRQVKVGQAHLAESGRESWSRGKLGKTSYLSGSKLPSRFGKSFNRSLDLSLPGPPSLTACQDVAAVRGATDGSCCRSGFSALSLACKCLSGRGWLTSTSSPVLQS